MMCVECAKHLAEKTNTTMYNWFDTGRHRFLLYLSNQYRKAMVSELLKSLLFWQRYKRECCSSYLSKSEMGTPSINAQCRSKFWHWSQCRSIPINADRFLSESIGIERRFESMPWFWLALIGIGHWSKESCDRRMDKIVMTVFILSCGYMFPPSITSLSKQLTDTDSTGHSAQCTVTFDFW